MLTMMKSGTFLFASLFLAAAPLAGQTAHSHGAAGEAAPAAKEHCAMHAEKHGEKHDDAVHRYAPKKLLEHRAMLNLTAAQVERLEALQAQHKADCHARMELVRAAETAAEAALLQEAADLRTFEVKLREAANLKVDCKLDMARTGQVAFGLLTPEQRTHLAHMSHGGHGAH
jgi:Spy/CpxP family protein refolding chaperone